MTALFILKIIGIVLLAIIGLVLALLLLVLFCPFFYQVRLVSKEQFEGAARVTWLFGLVRITVSYREKLNIILRVFGIPIYNRQKKKEKEKTEVNTYDDSEEVYKDLSLTNQNIDSDSQQGNEENNKKEFESEKHAKEGACSHIPDERRMTNMNEVHDIASTKNLEITADVKAEPPQTTAADAAKDKKQIVTDAKKQKSKTEKKTSKVKFADKLKRFVQRLLRYLSEIPDKIIELKDSFGEKCQKLFDTIEYYQKLAEKPGTKKVIQFLKKEIKLIFRHIKPYKGELFIDYQADDPAKAAKLMQLYALALPILPKKTSISSVFSEVNKLEFRVKIKGRFFLIYLGYHALIIVLNKKLKRFISLVKREE